MWSTCPESCSDMTRISELRKSAKKLTYWIGLLREAPFPLVCAFETNSPVRPFGSVRPENNHFFSTVFWGGDMKKRAIYRVGFRALEILGFSSFKKKDAQKLD